MPVRVYDIAKKLGLENKEILTKAKELGIAAAKVASSSLDKISAEWLEEEIVKSNPAVASRLAPKPVEEKPKPVVEEKIQIIHAPEPPPAPVVPVAPAIEIPAPAAPVIPPSAPKPTAPIVPPAPAKPQMGEKIGFIQLSPRPGDRGGDRGATPQRSQPGGRSSSPPPRGDGRGQQFQRGRDGRPQFGAQPAKPAAPQTPKISLPSDAQVVSIKPPIVAAASSAPVTEIVVVYALLSGAIA